MINETNVRVRYSETDAMGVVYYGNYLTWFEVGRTEWLRAIGHTYRGLEEQGFNLPVVEAHCEYKAPARYDDEIIIITEWRQTEDLNFVFDYQIKHQDGRILVTGWTRHLCVNSMGAVQRRGTLQLKKICREAVTFGLNR